jgi:hypothetical protein
MNLFERTAILVVMTLWWGGLTFYSAVVVPVGTEVLESTELQGLVTQQVTRYLNALGLLAVGAIIWILLRLKGARSIARAKELLAIGATLLALQGGLYWLHGELGRQLIEDADREAFYNTHRIYLLFIAVQWGLGLMSLVQILKLWRRIDHEKASVSNPDVGSSTSCGGAS